MLPPARIAEELSRIGLHDFLATPMDSAGESPGDAVQNSEFQVLDRLRAATQVDFKMFNTAEPTRPASE